MALHLRLCATLRYRGVLHVGEIEEMMPWEFRSYVDVMHELKTEDDKAKEK